VRLRVGYRSILVLGVAWSALAPSLSGPGRGAVAAAEPIPLTVEEYSGVARVGEPVTTGIPISPSQVGATWALFDGTREVALQTTVLPHRETPWLLLDFQTSLSASERRSFTLLQQAPAVSPPQPIVITETAQRITVTTGRLRTEVGKIIFNLLDNVWFDSNANGTFASGEQVVTTRSSSNLIAHDAGTNADVPGRGSPSRVEWEYRGPLRATLRVDGAYASGSDTLLNWTTRLTWYAGQTHVRIDHVLRNSNAARERYVKLSSARLRIGSPTATSRVQRSGSVVRTEAVPAGAALELIPATVAVSTAYDPDAAPPIWRVNTTVDVGLNGGLVIGDLSHHGATWWVGFESLTAPERARRASIAADPLVALADPERYSELGAFGLHRHSTYDDEKNAYRRWGWTWPTPGNPWSEEHNRPRVQDLDVSWSVVDASFDPESDDLWQNIVMFARVRIPFHLDRLRAWARYARWEWAFRTDGFDYAGAWGQYGDGPGTVSREPVRAPTLTAIDQAYIQHNIKPGKPRSSHLWNGGLLDAYYFTGDRDALEAAIDVAEQCERLLGWRTLETGAVGGNCRFQARCLLVLVRTWEATGQPRWRTAADRAIELFLQSPSYDRRGFYYATIRGLAPSIASRYAYDAKLVTPFMMATVVEALYRYYLATLHAAVRTQLLEIAAFAMAHGLDPATDYGGDEIVVDSPQAGDVLHQSNTQLRGAPVIVPYFAATSSQSFINALVIRYRLTGDRGFLRQAKHLWNQASKRSYNAPYDRLDATDSQVGRFANSLQGRDPRTPWFAESGNWTAVSLLFHEAARADTLPPAVIQDLGRKRPEPRPVTPPTGP
jgi:exo-rhamnogalacturonan lyase-like protein